MRENQSFRFRNERGNGRVKVFDRKQLSAEDWLEDAYEALGNQSTVDVRPILQG